MFPYKNVSGAAGIQVTTHPIGVLKLECHVNVLGAGTLFLQIHDSATVPADGAVPLRSWLTSGATIEYKEFKRGELRLVNGMYICISTNEAIKTLGTGNDRFGVVHVDFAEPEEPSSSTYVGDLTTPISVLQVWSQAAGAAVKKSLLRVSVTDTGALTATRFLLLFTNDIFSGVPAAAWQVRQTTGLELNFGLEGLSIVKDGLHGCTLTLSDSPTVNDTNSGDAAAIKAEYK